MEEPGLRVQPSHAGLVRHLYVRTELDEPVERTAFGGADVGSGDDPQRGSRVTRRPPTSDEFGQLVLENP